MPSLPAVPQSLAPRLAARFANADADANAEPRSAHHRTGNQGDASSHPCFSFAV